MIDWNTQIKNKPTIPTISGANTDVAIISGGGSGITGTMFLTFTNNAGAATAGNLVITDTGDFAGIQFNSTITSTVTKESIIHGNSLASLEVVNNVGTNDFIVFQNAGIRIPHISTGTTGGTQACFDGSFNLSSGSCGGNTSFTDMTVDASCLVSASNSATANSIRFATCFAAHPTGNLILPTGNYNIHNLSQPGINGGTFSGRWYLAPGAVLICDTISTASGDIAFFNGGTNLIIDGFTSTCTSTVPQSRSNAGVSGNLGLHLQNQTNPKILNTTIAVSAGTCFMAETSTGMQVINMEVNNCSANGTFFKELNDFTLDGLICNVTFDNCVEDTTYTSTPFWVGNGTINNVIARNSTANGIAIVGGSHVVVTNSYVNAVCGDGIIVFQDSFFLTAVPSDVRIMGATVIGAGTYTNTTGGNTCAQIGNGLEAGTVGDVYFDNIDITGSTAYAGYFSSNTHVTAHNLRGYGNNVGGFNFLNNIDAKIDSNELSGGTGGFFAGGNATLFFNNNKTHNVNPANGLHRCFDLESNGWVTGNGNVCEDTQATPTGYILLGITSGAVSPFEISFNVPNTPICTMAAIPTSYSNCVQIDSTFVVNAGSGAGSGVTAINTSLIGNVTDVAITTSANSFSNVNVFSQGSAGATLSVTHTTAGGIALAVAGTVNSTFKPLSIKDNSAFDAPGIDLISHIGSQVAIWASDLTNVALDVSGATINHILSIKQNGNIAFPHIPTGTTGGTQACFDGSLNITSGSCASGGVLSVNGITGAVTGVVFTNVVNTFLDPQIIAANGAATVGLLELNDGLSTATGIQIDELSSRIANWNAGPTFSFEVVNSSGTNDLIVFQNGGVRIPHIPGGSGGLAACFDASQNLYKSTSGSCP